MDVKTKLETHMRQPRPSDGAAIWRLIGESPPLELNSCYAYLLLCEHFADTCVVAEQEGDVVGCIVGYRPPKRADTVFVWQIAVHEKARGQGLSRAMLDHLIQRDNAVHYLDTTVTPSNAASRGAFHSLARSLNASIEETVLFESALFGGGQHEDEVLIHIGPLGQRNGS